MRGRSWRRHQRERHIRNRVKRFHEVFDPPRYGTPMWHWNRPPWWWWRRDYAERPLPPGHLDKARCPPTHANVSWERERKSWKMVGRHRDKVWRARKLGFDYPRRAVYCPDVLESLHPTERTAR